MQPSPTAKENGAGAKVWLMVWPNHAITVFYNENDAIINAKKHGFAIIPIDREVTEGEGL